MASTGISSSPAHLVNLRIGLDCPGRSDEGGLSFYNGVHHTQFVPPSSTGTTGDRVYVWPENEGSTGQFVQLASGGQLQFAAGSSGGGSTGNFANNIVFTTGVQYPEIKAERGYLRIQPTDTGSNARLRLVPLGSDTGSQQIILFDLTASTGNSVIEVRKPGDTGNAVSVSIDPHTGDLVTTGTVTVKGNQEVDPMGALFSLTTGDGVRGDYGNMMGVIPTTGGASMAVTAQDGIGLVNLTRVRIASNTNTTAISAPSGTGETRKDVVYVDSDSTVGVETGTPTTGTPSAPSLSTGKMALAELLLSTGTTGIGATGITSVRVFH